MLCTASGANVGASPVLTQPSGSSINLHKDAFTVGTAAAADIRIEGGNCEAEHALIERKSGRVFCTGGRPTAQWAVWFVPTVKWRSLSEFGLLWTLY